VTAAAAAGPAEVLATVGLTARYGSIEALAPTDMHVEDGELVAVLGPNGAGKSTLLRALMGLVTNGGTVRFRGRPLPRRDPVAVAASGVVLVPEGRGIFGPMTVAENLELGAYRLGRDKAEFERRWTRVFDLFPRLKERHAQAAGSMSGGEQQMLAIGRALMARPKVILMDEPSLGLSPKLIKDIFEIIVRLNREQKATILLVEQNAKVALETAHFGYVLEVGRIVMEDTTERLMEKEDIKEFYLGMKEEGVRGKRRWKKRKTWR